MRRWAFAVLLLVSLLPLASAQPEPEELVERACDLSPVDLPVCPREEPAPAPAPAEPHAHAEAPVEAAPRQVADEARDAVEESLDDPPSAPGRLAGLVASLVQRVRDLLDLPAAALDALGEARVEVSASLGALLDDARAKVASWLARGEAGGAVDAASAALPRAAEDASGLLDGALQRVPSPIAR